MEGRDVLFRVSLAILKMNEPDILAAESLSDLFAFISGVTSRLWAADKLINVGLHLSIGVADNQLQHSFRPVIKAGDMESRVERQMKELVSVPDEGERAL